MESRCAPVDPRSQQIIDWISVRTPSNPNATSRMHPDFGPPPCGIGLHADDFEVIQLGWNPVATDAR